MPTQAFPYLALSDGVTTLVLADGLGGQTNYAPVNANWSPAIAPRRGDDQLGGQDTHAPVTEELTINIYGATAAAAMANLATLALLLEQAERWSEGQAVNPVVMKYAPQGSTLSSTAAPLQAVILGRVGGDETTNLTLPVTFNEVGKIYTIQDVKLRVQRRGKWIATTTETVTSSTNTASTVLSATFANAAALPAPTRVGVTSTLPNGLPNGAVLLVANAASKITPLNAPGMTGTGFTAVNDASKNPRNGTTVLRYTPTTTDEKTSGTLAVTVNTRRTAVYAVVRNNSATTTWTLRFTGVPAYGNTVSRTQYTTIDASVTTPRAIFFGLLVNSAGTFNSFNCAVTASAASGTLDIDCFVLLDLDDETSRALVIAPTGLGSVELAADPMVLTGQRPLVGSPNFTAGQPLVGYPRYEGDPFLVTTGTGVAGLILAPTATLWRATTTVPALIPFSLRASRALAYLTPQ